jgi:hypothetical protein
VTLDEKPASLSLYFEGTSILDTLEHLTIKSAELFQRGLWKVGSISVI